MTEAATRFLIGENADKDEVQSFAAKTKPKAIWASGFPGRVLLTFANDGYFLVAPKFQQLVDYVHQRGYAHELLEGGELEKAWSTDLVDFIATNL